jgi:hypothetical protein
MPPRRTLIEQHADPPGAGDPVLARERRTAAANDAHAGD